MERKHIHKDAFLHMQYYGRGKAGSINLTIWNSRDGVTPFITYCKEYGIELQHISWTSDRYDISYKPKKGDLIWRDWRKEEIEDHASKQFDGIVKDLKAIENFSSEEVTKKFGSDMRDYMQSIVDEGKQAWIEKVLKDIQPGEPHLELVEEDWK